MINHFLDLHTEHTPKERCNELGDALARNRKYPLLPSTPMQICPFSSPSCHPWICIGRHQA
ncbi:hypothetical protein F5Y09DRAFT_301858 [Xylaria sp. FL1042]|nr:hypothetical protein F5Y09DRAFT_301858 [Xylaria sp. FL1042]